MYFNFVKVDFSQWQSHVHCSSAKTSFSYTVEPRYNEPRYNKDPVIVNKI